MSIANPELPGGFPAHADAMVALAGRVEGHLSEREVRFLALLGALPTCHGEVLEIGSYKGRSTVILAKSAQLAASARVVAVDPLDLPADTDPTETAAGDVAKTFYANLRAEGVDGVVEFHQERSEELARRWDRPLRLLWIDGDHTLAGARRDYEAFRRFLRPGAIVALHDVLHRFPGPVTVLAEDVLSSAEVGACGVVGSIGWAQYLGDAAMAAPWRRARETLQDRLAALVPQSQQGEPRGLFDKWSYKVRRARVPHGMADPVRWARGVVRIA